MLIKLMVVRGTSNGSPKSPFLSRALRLVLVSCVMLACGLASVSAQAMAGLPACEAKSPTIDSVTLKEVTMAGVALEAQINPEGNETSYEFLIVWRALKPRERGEPLPDGSPTQEGHIGAGTSDVTVSAFLSGLQPGYTYWYQVVATSLGNVARSETTALPYFNPDWYYSGFEEGPPYVPPDRAGCSNESGNLAAAETVREQREKEDKEATAKEAVAAKEQEEAKARAAAVLASEEAVRKRHAEEAAASVAQSGTPACVVPSLRGDTLTSARRALSKAHCKLGKVSKSLGHHKTLVVSSQSAKSGKTLADGAAVAVKLGPARG